MHMRIVIVFLYGVCTYGKILRAGEQFVADFVIVDSHARVMSNCIQNFTSKNSVEGCVMACVEAPLCKSFNHHVNEEICELLNISKFDDARVLRRKRDWDHYETDDDASQVGPVCNSLLPCKDYEVCEDTFKHHTSYKCKCKDGFYGDKCQKYSGPGSSKDNPAGSCSLLLRRFKLIADGKYWFKGHQKSSYCGRKVDGNYTEWGSFGECSTTCGSGVHVRTRNCTNPPPRNNGRDCLHKGEARETRSCENVPCLVCSRLLPFAMETPIRKGALITTITNMQKEFSFEFELKIKEIANDGWYNILHASTGNTHGKRIPAIFLNLSDKEVFFQVSYAGNEVLMSVKTKKLSVAPLLNRWITFKTAQVKSNSVYKLTIRVDAEFDERINPKPTNYDKVNVYMSNEKDKPLSADVRNVVIKGACNPQ